MRRVPFAAWWAAQPISPWAVRLRHTRRSDVAAQELRLRHGARCTSSNYDYRTAPPEYKQRVVEMFNQRTTYDRGNTLQAPQAQRLVELAQLQPGERVLDICTGTGLVLLQAADVVGPRGYALGVDISPGMLAQARAKLANRPAESSGHIELLEADVDTVQLPADSFDAIFCCSSLPYLPDAEATLRRWHGWLAPHGRAVFNCYPEYFTDDYRYMVETARDRYGISLPDVCAPLATQDRRQRVLVAAGFKRFEVITDHGTQQVPATPEQYAERMWQQSSTSPFFDFQAEAGAAGVDAAELQRWHDEYMGEIARRARGRLSNDGSTILNPYTAFNVLAWKE